MLKLSQNLTLIFCSIALLIVNACKKDSSEPSSTPATTNTNNQNCKVENFRILGTLLEKYFYDTSGKIIKKYDYKLNGQVSDSILYSYSSTTVIAKTYSGNMVFLRTYYIGNNGYADIMIDNSDGSYCDTTHYTYDNNGYLLKSVNRREVITCTIINKNVAKEINVFDGDSTIIITDFYTDKIAPNVLINGTTRIFNGANSYNLPKKITRVHKSKGTTTTEEDTYIYDNNLLTRKNYIYTDENNDAQNVNETYEYLCK